VTPTDLAIWRSGDFAGQPSGCFARAELQRRALWLRGRSIFVSESESTMRSRARLQNRQNQRDKNRKTSLARLKKRAKTPDFDKLDPNKPNQACFRFLSKKRGF
jgi:hypothetical protein